MDGPVLSGVAGVRQALGADPGEGRATARVAGHEGAEREGLHRFAAHRADSHTHDRSALPYGVML